MTVDRDKMIDGDLTGLTDYELARELVEAEAAFEREGGDTDERVLFALNEVAARLDLPLDETAQGLTRRASTEIDKFVTDNGGDKEE